MLLIAFSRIFFALSLPAEVQKNNGGNARENLNHGLQGVATKQNQNPQGEVRRAMLPGLQAEAQISTGI